MNRDKANEQKSKRASREQLDKTPSGPHPQRCLALFSPVLERGNTSWESSSFHLSPFSPNLNTAIIKDSGHHPACCCCLLWSVLQLLLACDVTSPPPFPDPTLSSSPLIQWSFLLHKSECCHVTPWYLLPYF